ncbi:MAG: ATP-binding protein [Polyangiaceae bacterium]
MRDQIAECVAAFANAEGGVAIFGIEDDGSVTGHTYPKDAVDEMLRVPSSRVQPPLADGFRVTYESKELLVFEVPAADAPIMVTGNGYPLRVGDTIVKMEEPKIRALKVEGLAESWGNRPSSVTLADLDRQLLARAKAGAGYPGLSDEEYLLKRKLADRKGTGIVLRRAGELLFSRDPDHANAGVRIFRVLGTERREGTNYNVEERPRVEGPLPAVLDGSFNAIAGLLRKPSRLRGTRFKETPEYPDFAWREAILNAVAHRDYGNQGRSVEVSLFDDHMDVESPGGLLPEIQMDALRARKRVHQSRNPRIVRALVDLGFMRDQGEGIPRLFAEMEGQFLPAPELESSVSSFRVTLRNSPTLTQADDAFIASLGSAELSDLEFRALLEASRHGRVDNARMREIAGLDTLGASRLLGGLRDRNLLVLHPAGSSSFYELARPFAEASSAANSSAPNAGEYPADSGGPLDPMGGSAGRYRGLALGDQAELPGIVTGAPVTSPASSRHLTRELPSLPGGAPVTSVAKPTRAEQIRERIRAVCSEDWKTPAEIARALAIRSSENLTRRHLGPMVEANQLKRRHDEKNHPAQAYRTVEGEPEGNP